MPMLNYAPAPAAVIARVAAMEDVCAVHDVPLAAAALQFPLAHPLVASVIAGLDSGPRVEQGLMLYRRPIPAALWRDLRREGLLDAAAPVPAPS